MSFVRLLQGIGDRLGILETAPDPGKAKAERIQTRSVSLRELASEIKSGAVRSLADAPSELAVPFEKIYEAAGIPADSKSWTVDTLKGVIAGDRYRGKSREEVQKSVLALLNSEGISAEAIVKDAMARDAALDAYETFVRDKMQTRMKTCKARILEVETRIRDMQEERKSLENALKGDEEKWREWKKNKSATERELASLVGYVVDHRVITSEEGKE